MESLFEMRLEKSWVNQGDFNFEFLSKPHIYVESFSKTYIELTATFRVGKDVNIYTTKDDTELSLVDGEAETKTIIPTSIIGDNLENLFTIIHEIFDSIHVSETENNHE